MSSHPNLKLLCDIANAKRHCGCAVLVERKINPINPIENKKRRVVMHQNCFAGFKGETYIDDLPALAKQAIKKVLNEKTAE